MEQKTQQIFKMLNSAIVTVVIGIVIGSKSTLLDCLFTSSFSSSLLGNHTASPLDIGQNDYRIQIFSRDPLIIYVRSFLSKDEIDHVLKLRFVSRKSKDNLSLYLTFLSSVREITRLRRFTQEKTLTSIPTYAFPSQP